MVFGLLVKGLSAARPITALAARRAGMGSLSRAAGVGALVGAGLASFAGLLGGNGQSRADPFSGANLTFPDDLANNDHWISFEAQETTGRAASAFETLSDTLGGLKNMKSTMTISGGSVFLPMPSNLSTDYNPDYTTPDLGAVAGQVLKPFDRAMYGNTDIPGGVSVGGIAAGTTAGVGLGIAQGIAGKIPGAESGQGVLGALLKVAGGVAVNPHKIVLFTGVSFREHTFSWRLSPKNRQESDTIRNIIDFFKFYSHPEYLAGGLFFKYPEFFNIRFHHPDYLFAIRPSVCKDVKINYHTQGYPAYVRNADGGGAPAPAEIELTLTFLETEIVTKNSLNPPATK
jgi:hypothetical protein